MTKTYNFKDDLVYGDLGEQTFLEKFPRKLTKSKDNYEYDFFDILGDKNLITFELKTEFNNDKLFRRNNKWNPTVFIEKFSSLDSRNPFSGKPGGVYRAFNDDVHYFIYFFINYDCYFIFNTEKLYEFMINNEQKYEDRIRIIPNKKYDTMGYSIPLLDILSNIKPTDYSKGHTLTKENNQRCKEFIKGSICVN